MTMTHKEALRLAFSAGLEVSAEGVCYDLQNRIAEAIVKKYLDVCGLVVVPREPTDEMEARGSWARAGRAEIGSTAAKDAYRRMLAAAPDPFEEGE